MNELVRKVAMLLLACSAGAIAAPGTPMIVGDALVLACRQPQPLELHCDYRITRAAQPLVATATIAGVTLPTPAFAARTGEPDSVAVLLLVDSSDPARSLKVQKVQQHIARLLETAPAHLRFGLATFDSDLRLLAPVGSDTATINAAAQALDSRGMSTELYRNVVEGIKLLASGTDPHKVLLVMSDGLAEDRAYFHADAVAEALAQRIAVYGIGYPRSPTLAVALQALRRLADDTGGQFAAADIDFDLPERFFDAPFAAAQNVGALSVSLVAAAEASLGGAQSVRIAIETSAGPVQAMVPVELPRRASAEPVVNVIEVEVPRAIEDERVAEVPLRSPAPERTVAAPPPAGVPLWYWIAAIGVLALALVVLLVVLLLQRRAVLPVRTAAAPRAPLTIPGFAALTAADGEVHIIATRNYRIGRLADNDLVLRDPSVSRHHAEIHRQRDGSFQVLDLESMNGVLVNGKRVRSSDLEDGNSVEIGDVRLLFSTYPADNLTGEETVMLQTEVPSSPLPGVAGARR